MVSASRTSSCSRNSPCNSRRSRPPAPGKLNDGQRTAARAALVGSTRRTEARRIAARGGWLAEGTTMSWVLFDYGGVICYPQPEEDLAALARAAGCTAAEFSGAYWPYRLDYDRAVLDSTGYWQRVA